MTLLRNGLTLSNLTLQRFMLVTAAVLLGFGALQSTNRCKAQDTPAAKTEAAKES